MSEERLSFIIESTHAGLRIDSVLSLLSDEYSRAYIQKLIENGNVSVDGKVCISKKYTLSEGQSVELAIPAPAATEALPEDIPLDIVYEDDDVIVANKARGMVVHPAAGNPGGTLVNALLNHCGALSSINGAERPGIVHRIDKDTSGLIVAAKNDDAHIGLAAQFACHSITRLYNAIVYYGFRDKEGTVDAPVGRDAKNRLRMAISAGGKRAVTHYRVTEEYKGFSLIEARLETGRTHQIRVHMSYIRHPLLGDTVYGPAKHPYGLTAQMLHAGVLGFVHPLSGKYMEFSCPPPADFAQTLEKLRKK